MSAYQIDFNLSLYKYRPLLNIIALSIQGELQVIKQSTHEAETVYHTRCASSHQRKNASSRSKPLRIAL